jgi:MFS family permease
MIPGIPWTAEPWLRPALLLALASFVETLGFGHLGAFTPLYLERFGVPHDAVPLWTGMLTAISFVPGLPLAPLWGVWADRYGRKLIIIRSTIGEGLIFLIFGIAGEAWHLLIARALVGFILGNTGVMYALLSDLTKKNQLASAIAFIGAGSTLGVSVGPFIGGWLVEWIGLDRLYQLDGLACMLVALLLVVGLKEERREPAPTASTLDLLRALPGNLRASPIILPLFGLYFIALLGMNLSSPFVPLLVAEVYHGDQLPVAIGTQMLAAGLLAAICGPVIGRMGGHYGHSRVLGICLGLAALGMAIQALASDFLTLLVARSFLGAVGGGLSPLVVSVIALATPPAQRGSVLNLTLYPGNLSFLIGGVGGSLLATMGLRAVFTASSVILGIAALLTANRLRGFTTTADEPAETA